LAGNVLDLT
jgi:hypothetical protein